MPSSRRSIGAEPEPPPGNELAAFLWVIAVLIGVFELVWWFFDRLYSPGA